jgi:hypothetical protein
MSPNNIQEFLNRCKVSLGDGIGEWGLIIVVFLVGFCAFGLGRLSALESAQPPVSVMTGPTLAKPQGMYVGGLYVASRTGSVYYYPWCTGGGNIAPDRQIWFQTTDAARAAGYLPAKNCKGLE